MNSSVLPAADSVNAMLKLEHEHGAVFRTLICNYYFMSKVDTPFHPEPSGTSHACMPRHSSPMHVGVRDPGIFVRTRAPGTFGSPMHVQGCRHSSRRDSCSEEDRERAASAGPSRPACEMYFVY